MKKLDKFSFPQQRRKLIIIEDSFMKYAGLFTKQSLRLTGRNPLRKDETVIDYEMDSEEEWNEQNGEDLENRPEDEDAEDEEEKMLIESEGEQEEGFIVPDDYLSVSELNFSQMENSQIAAQLEERKKNLPMKVNPAATLNLQPFVIIFNQDTIMDKKIFNYREEYKAHSFSKSTSSSSRLFPIRLSMRSMEAT